MTRAENSPPQRPTAASLWNLSRAEWTVEPTSSKSVPRPPPSAIEQPQPAAAASCPPTTLGARVLCNSTIDRSSTMAHNGEGPMSKRLRTDLESQQVRVSYPTPPFAAGPPPVESASPRGSAHERGSRGPRVGGARHTVQPAMFGSPLWALPCPSHTSWPLAGPCAF